MFCPNCALEERNQSQFCRACGTELHVVRTSLERSDEITSSAMNARDEIGLAIAAKIRELGSARDLRRVVEDILPKIEKFLESPEERRMRHLREGVLTAAVGLGALLASWLLGALIYDHDVRVLALMGFGAGTVVFLVGLGIFMNARWFTVLPKGTLPQPGNLKQQIRSERVTTGSLQQESPSQPPSNIASVTEGTTRQLRPDKGHTRT